jgi:hypothetical protein
LRVPRDEPYGSSTVLFSIYLSIHLSMHLSIYLSVCLSVCLSIYLAADRAARLRQLMRGLQQLRLAPVAAASYEH